MSMISTRERDAFHRDMAEQMAKPKALRALEAQARQLRLERERAAKQFFDDLEISNLRKQIRDMGGKPCA